MGEENEEEEKVEKEKVKEEKVKEEKVEKGGVTERGKKSLEVSQGNNRTREIAVLYFEKENSILRRKGERE